MNLTKFRCIGGEVSKWSLAFGKDGHDPHADQENPDHNNSHHSKKSVLTIMKEKAKKLKQTLSQKKHSHDHYVSTTPSWGVSLEDNEDEEHHLESPKYESELAIDWYQKTTVVQHPRADLFVSEKRALASSVNLGGPHRGKATNEDKKWSKGSVSVDNLIHSHEAEEDAKAISQETSGAISPRRRTSGVIVVVEKVREAVNSLLRNDQSLANYSAPINSADTSISDMPISTINAHLAKTSPSHDHLPISTNAHEGS